MLRVEAKTQEDNIIVLLTGCFCIGPGIDSRLAVLAPMANTADRDSQFVTLLLNNLTGPYDRAVWILFQGRMDKLTGPYEHGF